MEAAKAAGAIEAGNADLIKKVQDGWMDFDVAIATKNVMRDVSKLGRVLGPQGKMPSPKAGTVVEDVAQAVKEYAAGKVEYRNDDGGNLHVPVGKVSFDADKLIANVEFFLDTGASDVAIPEKLADRLGLERGVPRKYRTANGLVTAYHTRLDSVRIGPLEVRNVTASINPGLQGSQVLLGMSVLRQFDFSQLGDRLILRPSSG